MFRYILVGDNTDLYSLTFSQLKTLISTLKPLKVFKSIHRFIFYFVKYTLHITSKQYKYFSCNAYINCNQQTACVTFFMFII